MTTSMTGHLTPGPYRNVDKLAGLTAPGIPFLSTADIKDIIQ